jgi:hypothetical protein
MVSIGLVGVGGYLLQGGISFLSSQYGLAADVSDSDNNLIRVAFFVTSLSEHCGLGDSHRRW